jgi:hydrogenase expression/formation protein HypD
VRYVDEYRDRDNVRQVVRKLRSITSREWVIMEICGGQTHTIVKYGLDTLLPQDITLVHGPGCPVCVTPLESIDRAVAIASRPDVIFTSFGDMLRVPGSSRDLLTVKAEGGDVRVVYSPLDAVILARNSPHKKVVFFAVGFETTAPPNAMAVAEAHRLGLDNFSVLCSHVLVPPAMDAILGSAGNRVQGFLAAGHVCTVMGFDEYIPLADRYRTPIVVTGFEPLDILQGIAMTVAQLERGVAFVENQYARSVRREGNPAARAIMNRIFEVTDRRWRGIGVIPRSGYRLREEYARFDAERVFPVGAIEAHESPQCIAGLILQGQKKPHECAAFRSLCTPEHPLGAPMVSSEGACAAYYHYGTLEAQQTNG